jgi:hypothetical protein
MASALGATLNARWIENGGFLVNRNVLLKCKVAIARIINSILLVTASLLFPHQAGGFDF